MNSRFLLFLGHVLVLPGGFAVPPFFPPPRRSSFAPWAWSGRSGCASSAALRPTFARDRAGTSRGGAPRCSHEATPAIPHRGTPARGPHASAPWLRPPAGRIAPPPPALQRHARKGLAQGDIGRRFSASSQRVEGSNRRCRGWQISPEPAGTGRASRVGETAARFLANAEGPRRGSRPPVAGAGVYGRSGWGDARPHPATRGTGKTKPSCNDKRDVGRAPNWQEKGPRSERARLGGTPSGPRMTPRSGTQDRNTSQGGRNSTTRVKGTP